MFLTKRIEERQLETREEITVLCEQMQHLGQTTGEGERVLKLSHVAKLQEAIVSGNMLPFYLAIAEVEATETAPAIIRRVDGQHSVEAFLRLTEEQWAEVRYPVAFVITTYTCQTKDDIPKLFAQFKQRWQGRTREDVAGAFLANHPDLAHLSRYAMVHAAAGLRWYLAKAEGRVIDKGMADLELINLNSDFRPFFHFCGTRGIHDIEGLDLRKANLHVGQPSVLAAMFVTTKGGRSHDLNFWKRVSGGRSSITSGTSSCEYILAAYLEQCRDKTTDWPRPARNFHNQKAPDDVEMFHTCLRLFASAQQGITSVEMVLPVKERNVPEIIKRLVPLTRVA
jgi:hypothetical protein